MKKRRGKNYWGTTGGNWEFTFGIAHFRFRADLVLSVGLVLSRFGPSNFPHGAIHPVTHPVVHGVIRSFHMR